MFYNYSGQVAPDNELFKTDMGTFWKNPLTGGTDFMRQFESKQGYDQWYANEQLAKQADYNAGLTAGPTNIPEAKPQQSAFGYDPQAMFSQFSLGNYSQPQSYMNQQSYTNQPSYMGLLNNQSNSGRVRSGLLG